MSTRLRSDGALRNDGGGAGLPRRKVVGEGRRGGWFFDGGAECAKISAAVEIRLDIPDDLFDDGYTVAAFEARVREFAVIELLRVKRLHEHEAARILGLERWELIEKMERAGIVPTEKEFDKIKGELGEAVASIKARGGKP
jgi:hypothetical protein